MRSHNLRSASSAGSGGLTPVFHYDFGAGKGSWDGSSTTINDISGNGNHTTFGNTTNLTQTTLSGAGCLVANIDPCLDRGNYTVPSGIGNSIGTGDYAIQMVWNPYLRPHHANYYYSLQPMTILYGSNGSYGPTIQWGEAGLLWLSNVNSNAFGSSPPWPPEFTGHAAQYNAAPAHTPQAPYPPTPPSYSYTGGYPNRFYTATPTKGYFGWEHAILTRVSGTLYCYRNGVQISSHTNPVNYSTFGGAGVLGYGSFTYSSGNSYCGYNQRYLGGFAIHKFFDVGLDATQVSTIFNAEKARFGL